jgi:hypothetical protein
MSINQRQHREPRREARKSGGETVGVVDARRKRGMRQVERKAREQGHRLGPWKEYTPMMSGAWHLPVTPFLYRVRTPWPYQRALVKCQVCRAGAQVTTENRLAVQFGELALPCGYQPPPRHVKGRKSAGAFYREFLQRHPELRRKR